MYIINKLDKESLKLTSLEILNLGKLHPVVFSATAQTKTSSTNLKTSSGIHGANSIAPFPEESKANTLIGNFLKGTFQLGLERTSVSIIRSVCKCRWRWKATF